MALRAALEHFRDRLRGDGAPAPAVEAFERMYREYRGGGASQVDWERIAAAPPDDLVGPARYESARFEASGRARLGELAWVVLNGGLGTSMKMEGAKSLVRVKGDATFLDLICRFALRFREREGVSLPVLFMNSFATEGDTLSALAPYRLAGEGTRDPGLPASFLQQRFPRIRESDGLPFGEAEDREAWAPPGHGNLYLALQCSGLLDRLVASGYRWAFVSNADNLGAAPHAGILGYLVESGVDFGLEVTARTEADVKGGTLVLRGGRLELLELAQVPPERVGEFQDPQRFPVFNTNNLWVNLEALRDSMAGGGPVLPVIVNRKKVGGEAIVQLETAMGAAMGSFPRAVGILVCRRRFAPVKTTDDLVVRRSDVYLPGEASPLEPNPARPAAAGPPVVRLDPEFFASVAGVDERVPHPLGLLGARLLEVKGDVRFGRDVMVSGEVRLEGPLQVADETSLTGP